MPRRGLGLSSGRPRESPGGGPHRQIQKESSLSPKAGSQELRVGRAPGRKTRMRKEERSGLPERRARDGEAEDPAGRPGSGHALGAQLGHGAPAQEDFPAATGGFQRQRRGAVC